MSAFSKAKSLLHDLGSAARAEFQRKGVTVARETATKVSHSMHLGRGFAIEAGVYGAVGGTVGYAHGNQRGDGIQDAAIGVGLGVLGALGRRGFSAARSSETYKSLKAAAREGWEGVAPANASGIGDIPFRNTKREGPARPGPDWISSFIVHKNRDDVFVGHTYTSPGPKAAAPEAWGDGRRANFRPWGLKPAPYQRAGPGW